MKILAFTDLHSDVESLKKIVEKSKRKDIGVVVSCGDLTFFGDEIKQCFKLLSQINKKVLIIPGNHDDEEEINDYCEKTDNCININHKKYIIDDHIFVGYGEGGFGSTDPRLKLLSKKFKQFFKEHKGKKVLVLHGPPYGTTCDNKSAWYDDGRYNGSMTARNLILESELDLVLCGHIHECENCIDKIGETTILNPSKKGKIITIE